MGEVRGGVTIYRVNKGAVSTPTRLFRGLRRNTICSVVRGGTTRRVGGRRSTRGLRGLFGGEGARVDNSWTT